MLSERTGVTSDVQEWFEYEAWPAVEPNWSEGSDDNWLNVPTKEL